MDAILCDLTQQRFHRDLQDLGKQIGEAGRDFAREHWRWEVMQSYMFRVILE